MSKFETQVNTRVSGNKAGEYDLKAARRSPRWWRKRKMKGNCEKLQSGRNHILYTVRQGTEMGRPSTLYVDAVLTDGQYLIQVGGKSVIAAEGDWK